MNTIGLISSYSKDTIYKHNTSTVRNGGPAYFIEKVFGKNLENHTKDNNYDIDIFVKDGDETGKITEKNVHRITQKIISKNIIISTIYEEFLWSDLRYLHCENIFIDLQGFCRVYTRINNSKYLKNKKIFIKATKKECQKISKNFFNVLQKKHTLIITNASQKICMYHCGVKKVYEVQKIDTLQNTVGAGDTLFANFIKKYLETYDNEESMIYALQQTNIFLTQK